MCWYVFLVLYQKDFDSDLASDSPGQIGNPAQIERKTTPSKPACGGKKQNQKPSVKLDPTKQAHIHKSASLSLTPGWKEGTEWVQHRHRACHLWVHTHPARRSLHYTTASNPSLYPRQSWWLKPLISAIRSPLSGSAWSLEWNEIDGEKPQYFFVRTVIIWHSKPLVLYHLPHISKPMLLNDFFLLHHCPPPLGVVWWMCVCVCVCVYECMHGSTGLPSL